MKRKYKSNQRDNTDDHIVTTEQSFHDNCIAAKQSMTTISSMTLHQ